MKKFLIFILPLIIVGAITWFFALPIAAQASLKSDLRALGFSDIAIGESKTSINGVTFKSVSLDPSRKMRIKEIQVNAPLHHFMFGKAAKHVIVNELSFNQSARDLNSFFKDKERKAILNIFDLAHETITVKDLEITLTDLPENIKLLGNLSLKRSDNNFKNILGTVRTESNLLALQSDFRGLLNSNAEGNIDADFLEAELNHTLFDLKRASGWFNYTKEKDKAPKLSSQIDAGNGRIFKVPAINISLILGANSDKKHNLLLQSQASGVKSVHFSIDMGFDEEENDFTFLSTLSAKNMNDFLTYLRNTSAPKLPTLNSFEDFQNTTMKITYLPEKRFVDGPLPFELNGINDGKPFISGTLLIYPDDSALRGTVETSQTKLKDVQKLFNVPNENISENVLRIDSNLKDIIF